ncbi:insulinase family protein [Ruminiclostridium herbifermentans]|uniref:Insulinase family protein n=1 Tax=Ruminiclostridium herbifermentans TaxID=2488810 RepID=A0A4U7JJE8_9FIRM|nr:pitrilysin family protein [Ruminiclostridium herbifermentans]QNU66187.1 insulinase family protein [Ruminiclostridium herbifermentans]
MQKINSDAQGNVLLSPDTIKVKKLWISVVFGLVLIGYYLLGNIHTSMDTYIPKLNKYNFENGLSVVEVDGGKSNIITFVGAIKCGSLYQNNDNRGLFHYLEHMLILEPGIQKQLQENGAVANAYTSQDYMIFKISVQKRFWKQGLGILKKMMINPKLDNDVFEKERKVILYEAQHRTAEITDTIFSDILSKSWGEDSYKLDIIGDSDIINNVEIKDLYTICEHYFVPSRALVVASGDIAGFDIRREIENEFGEWAGENKIIEPEGVTKKLTDEGQVLLPVDSEGIYTTLLMVWNGPGLSDDEKDACIADVFCAAASDSNSAFYNEIMKNGYVKRFYVYYKSEKHDGPIVIYATVKKEDILKAKEHIKSVVQNKTNYYFITKELLQRTKNKIVYDWINAFECPSEVAKLIAIVWASKDLEHVEKYLKIVKKVSRNDIENFGEKYLISSGYIWGSYANPQYLHTLKEEK